MITARGAKDRFRDTEAFACTLVLALLLDDKVCCRLGTARPRGAAGGPLTTLCETLVTLPHNARLVDVSVDTSKKSAWRKRKDQPSTEVNHFEVFRPTTSLVQSG